jgi:hypothetical protein
MFFGWGMYADYSLEIARFFVGDEIGGVGSAGAWGDTFGAFNGLVSLAGAVFVVRTLMLQQSALAEQQKALRSQADDAHRQRFEATFFELLRLLRELRSELRFTHSQAYIRRAKNPELKAKRSQEKHGLDALSGFLREMNLNIAETSQGKKVVNRSQLAAIFDELMATNVERTFAPYFRMVYTILNRLRHDNVISNREKENYSRLLRSQLTNSELLALAHNSFTPRSADLEELINQFRLLKYMPASLNRTRLEQLYDPIAFQARD